MLLLVSGCARDKPSTTISTPQQSGEPWFCQTGEDTGEWDCIRDEALAATPMPTRSPPKEVAGTGTNRPTFISRPGLSQPPPANDRKTSTPAAAPESKPTSGSKPDKKHSRQNRQRKTTADVPKHVRLAYQPEQAVSLMDLPDEFFAVQLIALSSKENLENYAREHKIKGMSAAEVLSGGQVMYVLLLGIYESRAIAEEASADLGPPYESPWIRSMGSLKAAMVEAESLNASTTPTIKDK